MNYKIVTGSFLVFLLFPLTIFAGPIIRSGDSVSVGTDQVLDGDFYGLGGDISLSGEAKHDVNIAGGTVTVNGPVSGDLVVLGGSVQIHAPVTDDVRIVGGEVVLASTVGGDVVVLGGVLKILPTAEITGDVLYIGGQLDVSGPVRGSVIGRSETVRIDAPVGKDVKVTAVQKLSLGDRADIEGEVLYKSTIDIVRAQKSVVVGSVRKDGMLTQTEYDPFTLMLPFLTVLFVALTVFMLFRVKLQRLTSSVATSYGVLGLIGLGVLLVVPVVSIVLMISVIGAILGIMLLLLYFLGIIGAWMVSGAVIGTLLLKPLTHSSEVTFLTTLVGTLCFTLVVFIPYIGPLLMIAGFVVVLGGISREVYRSVR